MKKRIKYNMLLLFVVVSFTIKLESVQNIWKDFEMA